MATEILFGTLIAPPTRGVNLDERPIAYGRLQRAIYKGEPRESPRRLRAFDLAANALCQCAVGEPLYIEGWRVGLHRIDAIRIERMQREAIL